uniref:Large ribosomal subunit protein mL42 n=1 Tax=Strongyloides papillosus TaxID=174720 RepID=A0A0N5CFX2_STREA
MFGSTCLSTFPKRVATNRKLFTSLIRPNLEAEAKKNHIVVTKSGTVLCWHPEQEFPYEHSLPVQKTTCSAKSPLLNELKKKYPSRVISSKGPTNKDLQEIFYTNKNEWYSRTREDKLYQTSAKLPKRK